LVVFLTVGSLDRADLNAEGSEETEEAEVDESIIFLCIKTYVNTSSVSSVSSESSAFNLGRPRSQVDVRVPR
jgi:hypothetical protein